MKKILLYSMIALATGMVFGACEKTGGERDVAVTGVTLDTHTKSIAVDGEFTLTATVNPAEATNKTVDWQYDETVVSVTADPADGNRVTVKALKEGSTTITVSTDEVGANGQPFTDQCEVTVSAVVVPDPEATITHTYVGDLRIGIWGEGEATIDWGDGSVKETVTLTPLVFIGPGYSAPDGLSHHTYAEGSDTKTITVTGAHITGFAGGYTTAVTQVDVTELDELQYFDFSNEVLPEIDVTNNSKLVDLYAWGNQLSTLDVSGNPELRVLSLDTNNLNREAIVKIFNDLPVRVEADIASMWCGSNPGWKADPPVGEDGDINEADMKIATDKFWILGYW